MKKSKKIVLRILPIVMLLLVVFSTNVFAAGLRDFNPNMDVEANTTGTTVATIGRVWGVILTALQVAAIAAVVFAGVRYMFASADSKADIKKLMIWLAVGALLVFDASTVINILINVTKDIAG